MLVKFSTRHGAARHAGRVRRGPARLGGHSGTVPSAVLAAELPGVPRRGSGAVSNCTATNCRRRRHRTRSVARRRRAARTTGQPAAPRRAAAGHGPDGDRPRVRPHVGPGLSRALRRRCWSFPHSHCCCSPRISSMPARGSWPRSASCWSPCCSSRAAGRAGPLQVVLAAGADRVGAHGVHAGPAAAPARRTLRAAGGHPGRRRGVHGGRRRAVPAPRAAGPVRAGPAPRPGFRARRRRTDAVHATSRWGPSQAVR